MGMGPIEMNCHRVPGHIHIYPYIPAPLPNAQCHAPTTRAVRLFLLEKLRQFCLYVACGVALNASYLAMENLHLLKHFLAFFFFDIVANCPRSVLWTYHRSWGTCRVQRFFGAFRWRSGPPAAKKLPSGAVPSRMRDADADVDAEARAMKKTIKKRARRMAFFFSFFFFKLNLGNFWLWLLLFSSSSLGMCENFCFCFGA